MRAAASALLAAWLLVGCGGGGDTAGDRPPGASSPAAPLPPLPDPAPARECTGTTVLCVDAGSTASAPDGSAGQPFASVREAIAAAEPDTVIQVAAGEYDEPLEISGARGLQLIGGFPAGDFSQRDPAVNETVLRGNGDAAVVSIVDSDGVRIEGFGLTGGGGHSGVYRLAGGGVYVDETASGASMVANRIYGNAVDRGSAPAEGLGGGIAAFGTDVSIVGNLIEGNRAGRGAGIAVVGGATIDGNVVRDNVGVGDHAGGLYLAGRVEVTRNRVQGNRIGTDYGWGGGIHVFGDDSAATLRGNVVAENGAPTAGSGVFIDDGADATLVGELYYRNDCTVQGGEGLYADSGGQTPTVVRVANVTVAEHRCPDVALGGNAILAEVSDQGGPKTAVTVVNSILWDNAGRDVAGVGTTVEVTYSITEEAIEGTGNLSEDPQFADPGASDFHLREGSPGIDAGDPSADVGAEPEPNGGRIDLGHTGGTSDATTSA